MACDMMKEDGLTPLSYLWNLREDFIDLEDPSTHTHVTSASMEVLRSSKPKEKLHMAMDFHNPHDLRTSLASKL